MSESTEFNDRVKAAQQVLLDAFKRVGDEFRISMRIDGYTNDPDGIWWRARDFSELENEGNTPVKEKRVAR